MTTHTVVRPSPMPSLMVGGALDGNFERLMICNDTAVGLCAVICIDSTVLGPADGGVRMFPYTTMDDAIADVTRLARAMTCKWAAAGEDRGGGKAVIIGDPRRDKTEALLRRFGQFVDDLGGEYWAGEDAGLTLADMEVMHRETDYVATLPRHAGGAGDIAPATAAGVLHAMRACAQRRWGTADLRGRRVALQGVGACGGAALEQLVGAGAVVVVSDVDEERLAAAVDRFGVTAVLPDEIFDVDADVFAPFAMGGAISDSTIDRLQPGIVAGSANNVVAGEELERELVGRGVLYAVDFIANAGGAIMDADRFRKGGFDAARVEAKLAAIGPRALRVLDDAAELGVVPSVAAGRLAAERLASMSPLRHGRRAS